MFSVNFFHLFRQAGQALVAGMLMLFIGSAMTVVYFSRAQLTIEKQKLTAAADSAAYSSALWRARAMNFDAYANRAIIAQEVAVAQAVTLTGWAQYFKTVTKKIDDVGQFIPWVNLVTGALKEEAEYASELAQYAASIEIPARAAAGYGYKNLLEYSQTAMGMSANTFALGAVAREVIRANDARFSGFVMPEPSSWSDMRKRYDSLEDKSRLLDVVRRNLDPFTGQSRTATLKIPGTGKCLPTLEKRGGTSLTHDLKRWESVDLMSQHSPKPSLKPGCNSVETAAWGYGAAESSESDNQDIATTDEFKVNDNAMAKAQTSDAIFSEDSYSGFASAMDLNYDQLNNKRFPTFDIAVLAFVDAKKVRTASNLNLAVGRQRNADQFADLPLKSNQQGMVKLSTAQVYFRKPTQSAAGEPKVDEYASLYSPYWQARLTEPNTVQRLAAMVYAE